MKSVVLSTNFAVFAISQGSLQQRRKNSNRTPPGRPDEPQARPGWPQECAQDGSKSRLERAKRRPRPPRSAPVEGQRGPKPPRRLQGALRELISASSWSPGGFIFEPSRQKKSQTRAQRGERGQKSHENAVRNCLPKTSFETTVAQSHETPKAQCMWISTATDSRSRSTNPCMNR